MATSEIALAPTATVFMARLTKRQHRRGNLRGRQSGYRFPRAEDVNAGLSECRLKVFSRLVVSKSAENDCCNCFGHGFPQIAALHKNTGNRFMQSGKRYGVSLKSEIYSRRFSQARGLSLA